MRAKKKTATDEDASAAPEDNKADAASTGESEKVEQNPETPGAVTMAALAEGYIAHLEAKGTSIMTRASYENDLKLALRELGERTKLTALSKKRVENYFESNAVCQTRTGRAKAAPTIAKTRRVLRLALVWAQEQGLVAEAPIPEAYQSRGGEKKQG